MLMLVVGIVALPPSPAVALDDLSRYVFIANRTSPEIVVVDTMTDRVAARLTVAAIPDQFVLSESQAKLIASHRGDKRLTIVDLRRLETEAVLELGFEPLQLQLDPFGSVLAVSGAKPDTVAILALDDIEERQLISKIADPGYLVFDVRAERLLVASRSAPRITAVEVASGALLKEIDLAGGRRITEIPLPSLPETGITADAGRKVYVALSGSDQVAVIDLMGFKLVKVIDGVGRQPWAVSMAGGLSYCH